jgi:ATP-dependent RNA helicase DDX18/HAS1
LFLITEKRQTILFSATLTPKTDDLAKLSFRKEPIYIGIDDNKEEATVEGLEQVNLKYSTIVSYII